MIFPDAEFKTLLLIPEAEQGDIRTFISRYFIEDAMPDEPVTDEKVRVIYYETEGSKLDNDPHITKKYLEFDIYVKEDHLYNVDTDRLCRRDKKISRRLRELLTRRAICVRAALYMGGRLPSGREDDRVPKVPQRVLV